MSITSGRAGIEQVRISPPHVGAGKEFAVPRFTEYREPSGPQSGASRSAPPAAVRPRKGRWFVGAILIAVCGTFAYSFWDGFLRYGAYGVVEGHVVDIMPPWNGQLTEVHVRDGQRVAAGQLLITLDNPDLRHELVRAEAELIHAEATLSAQTAQLQWQQRIEIDRDQSANAQYYHAWGSLLNEQAVLAMATLKSSRARNLASQHAISDEEVETTLLAESGQQQKVDKLKLAVDQLKPSAVSDDQRLTHFADQLMPYRLRVDSLRSEVAHRREQLARGAVTAPVAGVVIHRERLSGDPVHTHGRLLSLLEQDSAEVALYVSQRSADSLQIGDVVRVRIRPRNEKVSCVVSRIGQAYLPAPSSIQRKYLSNEPLLPVYLKPDAAAAADTELHLGAVVDLPRSWWSSGNRVARQGAHP